MIVTGTDTGWYSGDGPPTKAQRPNVVSIYAPRENKWGIDYDDCLDVLQASCDRLGLRHICISDAKRPRVETFVCDLPQNIMQMILSGQLQWLEHTDEPTLFVGADCILTRDPTGVAHGYDLGITTEDYGRINTGAMWCNTKACIAAWKSALEAKPVEWGDDQPALLSAIRREQFSLWALRVRELPTAGFNWHPTHKTETSDVWNPPMICHMKGKRKHLMRGWWNNFLRAQAVTEEAKNASA